jgi:hypothetical protein
VKKLFLLKEVFMLRQKIVTALAILFIANLLIPHAASAQTPPPPIQVSPPNGDLDQPNQILSFTWNDFTSYPDPATYRVQVSRNSNFTDLILDQNTGASTGYTIFNLPKNTAYYWRVNLTTRGQTSDWSPIWNFQTTNREIPGVPTLVSPANGATGIPRSPTLVWNPVEGADSYDLVIGPFVFYQIRGTEITIDEQTLSIACTDFFFWQVRSRNPAGVSGWSEMRAFTRGSF